MKPLQQFLDIVVILLWVSESNKMKATEQYFAVALLILLYKVVLTLRYVEEILKLNLFGITFTWYYLFINKLNFVP